MTRSGVEDSLCLWLSQVEQLCVCVCASSSSFFSLFFFFFLHLVSRQQNAHHVFFVLPLGVAERIRVLKVRNREAEGSIPGSGKSLIWTPSPPPPTDTHTIFATSSYLLCGSGAELFYGGGGLPLHGAGRADAVQGIHMFYVLQFCCHRWHSHTATARPIWNYILKTWMSLVHTDINYHHHHYHHHHHHIQL